MEVQLEELEKERALGAALARQLSDSSNNLDFISRLKDLAEADARAALLDRYRETV